MEIAFLEMDAQPLVSEKALVDLAAVEGLVDQAAVEELWRREGLLALVAQAAQVDPAAVGELWPLVGLLALVVQVAQADLLEEAELVALEDLPEPVETPEHQVLRATTLTLEKHPELTAAAGVAVMWWKKILWSK